MAKTISKDEINIGGSVFWILLIFIGFISLTFLMIQAFFQQSIITAVVAMIFLMLMVVGVLLSRLKVFDLASWGDNTLAFTIGFLLYIGLGLLGTFGAEKSIIGENFLFSTLSSQLPQLTDMIVNVFLVPIAEELVWMIGIPFVLITMMNKLGERFSIWKQGWLQIAVIIIIGSFTFAIFHQGKLVLAFIASALLFRSLLIFLVYGDKKYDIIKGVNVVAGFAVGSHMGNNLMFRGLDKVILLLNTNFFPVGLLVYAFFLVMFISAIERVLSLASGKKEKKQVNVI